MSTRIKVLVIAGVHKAGTTSLFEYLSQSPEVCIGVKKEIHHFTPLRYGEEVKGISTYFKNFSSCLREEKILLDASPSYLYGGKKIADCLSKYLPASKVVIVLREPVERLVSFYKYLKSEFRLDEDLTFREFVEESYQLRDESDLDKPVYRAFREGQYSRYLGSWIKSYGTSLKIVFFDDLKKDPKSLMKEIACWISIDVTPFERDEIYEVKNKTTFSRYKWLFQMAHFCNKKLEHFFRKNPQLKSKLRKVYFLLNGKSVENEISSEDLTYLKSLYSHEIYKLRKLLSENGHVEFPEWVKDASNNQLK